MADILVEEFNPEWPKHFELNEPKIEYKIVADKDKPSFITLTTEAPALWTWLEPEDIDARFSDNFFHLKPGKSVQITLQIDDFFSTAEIENRIHVHSLIDTYRKQM